MVLRLFIKMYFGENHCSSLYVTLFLGTILCTVEEKEKLSFIGTETIFYHLRMFLILNLFCFFCHHLNSCIGLFLSSNFSVIKKNSL